jgi:hypothetical protein
LTCKLPLITLLCSSQGHLKNKLANAHARPKPNWHTAEHEPDYRELGRFPTREQAEEFLSIDGY